MRRAHQNPLYTLTCLALCLSLSGCPPTGDPPPFVGAADQGGGGGVADEGTPDVITRTDAEPDEGPPPGCVDFDNDGYVTDPSCDLPSGDCAPEDPSRNPGVLEICNLIDDNCNGQTDENDPEGGEACETTIPGICREGRTRCVQGALECHQVQSALPAEACNGLDDTCNGDIDEGDPGGGAACDTGQPGLCAAGTEHCSNADVRCISDHIPVAETCNGEDDNCNGDIDEGNPEGGGACDTELEGVCAIGEQRCQGGALTCVATQEPSVERCDGRDDDCNGTVDDPWVAELGQPCVVGTGECEREGSYVCAEDGQGVICQASAGAGTDELCDGIDNDCDEEIDEDFPVDEACTVGVGACEAEGVYACAEDAQSVVCVGQPGEGSDEICNGIDDDCDGDTDEDFDELGQACESGIGECRSAGELICGEAGDVICSASVGDAFQEICNELDDDCDEEIDEDFPDKGQPCEVGLGECLRAGEWVCGAGGDLVCSVDPGPALPELCNELDDDCDGRVDNQAPCQGRPMGRVDAMRVAEFMPVEACRDFDGDAQADNAFGAVAGLFNGDLGASLLDHQRALYLQAYANHLAVMEGDAEGPLPRAFDERGVPRWMMPVTWDGDDVSSSLPMAVLEIVSPTFYDRGASTLISQLRLREAMIHGEITQGEAGLTAEGVRLTGLLDRAELLEAYAAAETLCLGQQRFTCDNGEIIAAARWCDGTPDCADSSDEGTLGCEGGFFTCDAAPLQRAALCDGSEDCAGGEDEALPFCPPSAPLPGCDILSEVPLAIFDANLEADLDLDDDGEFETVSACLILGVEPAPSLPEGGQLCEIDSDCYAGLVCRPLSAGEGEGLHLAKRCERPVGEGEVGAPCEGDEDCIHGLCVAWTASGGICTNLCDSDELCPDGQLCRGLASPLTEAPTPGGRTMRACQPTSGSQVACEHDCADGEVCAIYFDEGAGDPEAEVGVVGHCEAPHPEGAGLGEVCEASHECAHGGGCIDILGELRCLQPCAQPGTCGEGEVCMEVPVMGTEGVYHPHCLPLGSSATSCTSGFECEAGEFCGYFYLGVSDTIERSCVLGEEGGFFGVGAQCEVNEDCAMGFCMGFCSDMCLTHADCGPSLACHQDAATDTQGRVLGGLCAPAEGACQSDNDCRQDPSCCFEDDPNCLSNRCVCDNRSCRIGCRAGGTCPDGLVCLDNGRCALYCRDDLDEGLGNDVQEDATLLNLGRENTLHARTGHLCVGSPVDWYVFNHPGLAPYRLEISPVEDQGSLMEVEMFDAFGQSVRQLELIDGAFVYDQPLDEALAQQGQQIYIRVRGAAFERELKYNMSVDFTALLSVCPDPDPLEPRDDHWTPYEVLTAPEMNAQQVVEGRLCPMDDDWYKFWVGNHETLTITLERLDGDDPQPGTIEARFIGPDHPDEGIAHEIDSVTDNGQIVYTAPGMSCDSDGSRDCLMDDGTETRMFCYSDRGCIGIPYSLEIRSDRPLSEIPYRVTFDIQRQQELLCIPDIYEDNYSFMLAMRYHSAFDPDWRVVEQGTILNGNPGTWATLPHNTPITMSMRACGYESDYADNLADRDNISIWMNEGETFEVEIEQTDGTNQNLELQFVQWSGNVTSVQESYLFNDTNYVQRYTVPEDSVYGVVVVRQKNNNNPSYIHNLPYDLTITRREAADIAEQECDALGNPINFVFGNQSTVPGSTIGHFDDHRPLACDGGTGGDRVYAVDLPAGEFGLLRARVVAQDESDPAISIRTDCDVSFSEQACNEDDLEADAPDREAVVEGLFPGGQRIFLIVDSYAPGLEGDFLLTVEWIEQ